MTAPLLKTICSSSPCSRMASRTSFSFGSQVATIDRPTESGATPFLRNVSTSAGEGSGASGRLLFCGGVKEQGSVLGDHAIEKIEPRKHAHEIGQLSPSDEEKPPAGSPEGNERVAVGFVDDAIVCERAVIVGRQTADVHCSPLRRSPRMLAENSPKTVTVPKLGA